MFTTSCIVIILTAFSVTTSGELDSLYLKGARGMVPCNDGSFVGGFINCPTFPPGYRINDHCDRPVVTRSWDGGRTWSAEDVDAPDYAFSGIVRLRGGTLLTAHYRWFLGFIESVDNGRTWSAAFDTATARPVYGVGDVTDLLFRDHRGLLYWKQGGELYVSHDNGRTCVWLRYSDLRDGYYVLPPDGLLVTHTVGSGSAPGSIQMSFNHGRSWTQTLTGFEYVPGPLPDSVSVLSGCVTVRDTVVVADNFGIIDENLTYNQAARSMYWQSQSRTWEKKRHVRAYGYIGDMDSANRWFDGYSLFGERDTLPHYVLLDIPKDSIPPPGDTMAYTRGRLYGTFYDLDGNLHAHGSDVYYQSNVRRPVSRLDRLYTCTGVEYIVGGRKIYRASLDNDRSINARLTFRLTPNQRMATIVVEAIDTTRSMRFTMAVDDVALGRQWFTDSVNVATQRPVIEHQRENGRPVLTCTYAEGPYMWYLNGSLLPHRIFGMTGDSIIRDPSLGTYRVVGRSAYGCDVASNEVEILPTDVEERSTTSRGLYHATSFPDGTIHVQWSEPHLPPSNITVYDMMGRRMDATTSTTGNEVIVRTAGNASILYVVVQTQDGSMEALHCLVVPMLD